MIAVGGASDGHVCEPTGSAVGISRGGLADALREPLQVPPYGVSTSQRLEAAEAEPRCLVFVPDPAHPGLPGQSRQLQKAGRGVSRPSCNPFGDRKRVVEGKRVSVRVDLGGRRIIKKK